MKIVAIIQARMSSSRLPGKVLLPLAGKSVLSHVISRVSASDAFDEIVVATTEASKDDIIVKEASGCGVSCFRGSEDDVLSRYYLAAKSCGASAVLRVTSDDPLIDPWVLRGMLTRFRDFIAEGVKVDYLSNNLGVKTYPVGLDAEIFTFNALERAWKEASEGPDREHVTPYIYRHPNQFVLKNYPRSTDLSFHRWTLDTKEDWKFISTIYENLFKAGNIFSSDDVLNFLACRPELLKINSDVKQRVL